MSWQVRQLEEIRERIGRACQRVSRNPATVTLVAVSKTFPADAIRQVAEAGHAEFGESRQQEAAGKIEQLPPGLTWHFIGKLQRNKVRKVLADFQVIHSVGSLRLAHHIARIAEEMDLRPQVYLEVNLAGEEAKGGFEISDLDSAVAEVRSLEPLEVAGLMVIPPVSESADEARAWFTKTRELRDRHLPGAGLSMGMSSDFEVAIEEGATVVRVGSSIFGNRDEL